MAIQHNPQIFKSCFDWDKSSHDESYRYPYFHKDPPSVLRKKFAIISAAAFLGIPLLRFPSRCFFLITGSWGFAGYEKANKIWKQRCTAQTCAPSPLSYQLIGLCITKELIGDIAKCVTLPLALIGILFSSLWGMANPDDGRKLIGRIEKLWSIQIPKKQRKTVAIVNMLAMCFQDIQTWKELNIFQYKREFNPHTLRSLILSIENLHKDGLGHIDQFSAKLQNWNNLLPNFSPYDSQEIDEEGNLYHSPEESKIQVALLKLLQANEDLNEAIFCEANKGRFLSQEKRAELFLAITNAVHEVDLSLNPDGDLLDIILLESV